jgi:Family of unknown function (DUF5681)
VVRRFTMAKRGSGKGGEYEVGYGKPPKHTQFLPGQSGFKGRRKGKKGEAVSALIARIRDETHEVGGQTMTSLELAVRQVINSTIKSGKVADLKRLLDLLDRHGALPVVDERAEHEAAAQRAVEKIFNYVDRVEGHSAEDIAAQRKMSDDETNLIMQCAHCGPALREMWREPEYEARAKRKLGSDLHKQVLRTRGGHKFPFAKSK